MVDPTTMHKLGGYSFLIGFIIAIVLGVLEAFELLTGMESILMIVMVVLGIIIGFLNIEPSEVPNFLLAGVSLIVAAGIGADILASIQYLSYVVPFLNYLITFMMPALIVVAVQEILDIARH